MFVHKVVRPAMPLINMTGNMRLQLNWFLHFVAQEGVPLEPTQQPTLRPSGWLAESGIRDQSPVKKHGNNMGQFHLPDRKLYITTCLDPDPNVTWGQDVFLQD